MDGSTEVGRRGERVEREGEGGEERKEGRRMGEGGRERKKINQSRCCNLVDITVTISPIGFLAALNVVNVSGATPSSSLS